MLTSATFCASHHWLLPERPEWVRPNVAKSGGESTLTVLLAMGANLAVGVAKLVAGLLTGSAAMLSEAAHSVGDTMTEVLLLTALKRHTPGVHVTWVLQPGAASLVRGHWAVDEIVEFNRSLGWRAYPEVRRALATRPFDVVLALQVYFKAGLVTSFTRAPV